MTSPPRLRRVRNPGTLVDDQLIDGEEVQFDEAPDLVLFLLSQVDLYLSAFVAIVIMAMANDATITQVGIVGLLGIGGGLCYRLLKRHYTRYIITNLRIIRLNGVLKRDYEWIAWTRVTDVAVHRSLLDRIAQTATVRIQSANEHSGFKAMTDIPNPDAFAAQITELVNARRGGAGSDGSRAPGLA